MVTRSCNVCACVPVCLCEWTIVCLSFGPIGQKFTTSVTEACARRPGAAASVSRRRRERHALLAGGGRQASRSHTLAASQALERMHMLFCLRVKHLGTRRYMCLQSSRSVAWKQTQKSSQ
jgi:hypothetical protein